MPKRSSISQMLSINNDEPAAVLNIIEPSINNIDYSISQFEKEEDPAYIVRAIGSYDNFAITGGSLPNHSKMATLIGGMDNIHHELSRELSSMKPEQLEIFTTEDLLERMLESRGSLKANSRVVDTSSMLNGFTIEDPSSGHRVHTVNKVHQQMKKANDNSSFKHSNHGMKSKSSCDFCGHSGHTIQQCRKMLAAKAQLASRAKDPSGIVGK